ncbi:MAG: TIGR02281 family clan AA aspartic protease [Halioglobus sp.]
MSKLVRLFSLLLLLSTAPVGATEVEVQALFTNAAMLKIDGQSKLLKSGQSYGGVTLLEASSREAWVEIGGERRQVLVSQRITGDYEALAQRQLSIPRNSQMQYKTRASFNGLGVEVLVDTGANIVAMNSAQAKSLGIDFRAGESVQLQTASGMTQAWMVTLESIEVGGIRVDNVQASVVEGGFPTVILLGMTYLKHVDMQEKNGVMLISRDY